MCADMLPGSAVGPPMLLIEPSVPVNGGGGGYSGGGVGEGVRQRGWIVGGLLFLVVQQCVVDAVALRMLRWVERMEEEDAVKAEADANDSIDSDMDVLCSV